MTQLIQRKEYGILLGVIIVFGASLVIGYTRLAKIENMAATEVKFGMWLVSQAELEYLRLLNTVESYFQQESSLSHEQLLERFEIFWSRLPVLLEGSESQAVRRIEGVSETVLGLLGTLERIEPRIMALAGEARNQQHYQATKALLKPLEDELQKLTMSANLETRWQTAHRLHRVRTSQIQIVISFVGILVSVYVLLLIMFRERQRNARLLGTVRAVIEGISDAVFVKDRQGRCTLYNAAASALLVDLSGKTIGPTECRTLPPHLRNLLSKGDQEVMQTGQSQTFEQALPMRDGTTSNLLTSKSVFRNRAGELLGIVAVMRDITERKLYEERIRYLAHHDALTGLPNRSLFNDRLQQSMHRFQRSGALVAVHLLDLDHFKHVNDSLGHQTGDALLQVVSRRLKSLVRSTDTVARLGGDEFAIIEADVREPPHAARLAKKLLQAFADPFEVDGRSLHAGTTIGITLYPTDGGSVEELLKNADLALYAAKASGRNDYCFFAPAMGQTVARRNRLEDEIRQGLKGSQFILEYQPQIDLVHGNVSGAEALLRWRHPQRALLGPGEFMSVAEDCGLILPLGDWVLNQACAQAKAWENAGLTDFQISVNLSAVQLSQKNLDQLFTDTLHRNNLPPQRLTLEITETAVMRSNPGFVDHMLGRLDDLGIGIAIDDFGTGYASLSYLKRFPVSQVKIDRTFVEHLGANTEDSAIVRAVIGLGHDLNLNVVAEGVETVTQLNALREAACDTVQGYFISRPLAPEHFVPWIRSWEAARFRAADVGKPIAVKDDA